MRRVYQRSLRWVVRFVIGTASALACDRDKISTDARSAGVDAAAPTPIASNLARPDPENMAVPMRAPDDWPKPGRYRFSIENSQASFHYLVQIPGNYQSRERFPLIVAYHGEGDSAAGLADRTILLTHVAAAAGYLVVLPETAAATGPCASPSELERAPSQARLLLSRLERKLSIDPKRVYVFGYSHGAALAHQIASRLPDRIAALAAFGGAHGCYAEPPATPVGPVSALLVHADGDPVVPIAGGPVGPADAAPRARAASFSSLTTLWSNGNGCSAPPKQQTDFDHRRSVYECAPTQTTVHALTIHSKTHAFPARIGGISSMRAVIQFFDQHGKR